MKLVCWMTAGSILSVVAIAALMGWEAGFDALLGLTGPLVAIFWTWIAIERMYKRHPERVTSLMMKAFAAKMIFFAAYITSMLGAGLVRPIPFVISFTIYFLALHVTAAVSLRRLITA